MPIWSIVWKDSSIMMSASWGQHYAFRLGWRSWGFREGSRLLSIMCQNQIKTKFYFCLANWRYMICPVCSGAMGHNDRRPWENTKKKYTESFQQPSILFHWPKTFSTILVSAVLLATVCSMQKSLQPLTMLLTPLTNHSSRRVIGCSVD